MAEITIPGMFLTGTHASRPAANAVGRGALYSCTDHDLIYQSDGSTWSTWATLGSGAPAAHAASHEDGGADEIDVTGLVGAGGGASLPDQQIVYPSSFSGNDEDGTSVANFADVAAFNTKEVADSKFVHLVTLGASKDQRVRKTLGTTRAGAFDLRFRVAVNGSYWTAFEDVYWSVELRTAANAVVAQARLSFSGFNGIASRFGFHAILLVGGSTIVTTGNNLDKWLRQGEPVDIRIARDASNNVSFGVGVGAVPMVYAPYLTGGHVPYSVSSAGTVARFEIASHTPAGPGATAQYDLWLDYLKDAS